MALGGGIYLDNLDADLSGLDATADSTNYRFPYRELSPKLPLDPRLLSAADLNRPGQAHTNQVPVARYFDSWPNLFDPFPAGVFHHAPYASGARVHQLCDVFIGGKCQFSAAADASADATMATVLIDLSVELQRSLVTCLCECCRIVFLAVIDRCDQCGSAIP